MLSWGLTQRLENELAFGCAVPSRSIRCIGKILRRLLVAPDEEAKA